MTVLAALLLFAVLLACWVLTLLSLPGNWLMVLAVAIYAYFMPVDASVAVGWQTVVVLLVLACTGELLEFLAAALGTSQAGGSRRGALLALLGSFAGAMLGLVIGLPIPLVGPLVSAVIFAACGAMLGAMLGERSAGKNLETTWRIGQAAFWGRLAGTLGKAIVGAVMAAVAAAALIL